MKIITNEEERYTTIRINNNKIRKIYVKIFHKKVKTIDSNIDLGSLEDEFKYV